MEEGPKPQPATTHPEKEAISIPIHEHDGPMSSARMREKYPGTPNLKGTGSEKLHKDKGNEYEYNKDSIIGNRKKKIPSNLEIIYENEVMTLRSFIAKIREEIRRANEMFVRNAGFGEVLKDDEGAEDDEGTQLKNGSMRNPSMVQGRQKSGLEPGKTEVEKLERITGFPSSFKEDDLHADIMMKFRVKLFNTEWV